MTKSTISQCVDTFNDKCTKETFTIKEGWLAPVNKYVAHFPSPHFTPRDNRCAISLLVIHNISLPPNQFGGTYITDFFLGKLDKQADPYFETIHEMKVSAHCLIRRDGTLIQYVSFLDKAWHAGVSSYQGRDKCNDFSIGIELEGADDILYTEQQYQTLALVSFSIKQEYPNIKDNIAGHNEIAPGRKTDPGKAFDWDYFTQCLHQLKNNNL